MAEAVATGNSPYEVKTPGKEKGVGGTVRPRMFGLVNKQLDYLYNSYSLAKVAVYHSSSSRDFVAQGPGTGLYCSEGAPPSIAEQEEVIHFFYFTCLHHPKFPTQKKKKKLV